MGGILKRSRSCFPGWGAHSRMPLQAATLMQRCSGQMLFYLPTSGQTELDLATRGRCLRYLASKVREGKSPSVGDDPYKNQQLA
jgi:hypothetical protein